ncbi:MAG: hypothetical protein JSS53_07350 [Proteobacteria bacterium]|nr:hypothetical protein [Pseudomonadota bacterium]
MKNKMNFFLSCIAFLFFVISMDGAYAGPRPGTPCLEPCAGSIASLPSSACQCCWFCNSGPPPSAPSGCVCHNNNGAIELKLLPNATPDNIRIELDNLRAKHSATGVSTVMTDLSSLQRLQSSQVKQLAQQFTLIVPIANSEDLTRLKQTTGKVRVSLIIPESSLKQPGFKQALDSFIQDTRSTQKTIPDSQWKNSI